MAAPFCQELSEGMLGLAAAGGGTIISKIEVFTSP